MLSRTFSIVSILVTCFSGGSALGATSGKCESLFRQLPKSDSFAYTKFQTVSDAISSTEGAGFPTLVSKVEVTNDGILWRADHQSTMRYFSHYASRELLEEVAKILQKYGFDRAAGLIEPTVVTPLARRAIPVTRKTFRELSREAHRQFVSIDSLFANYVERNLIVWSQEKFPEGETNPALALATVKGIWGATAELHDLMRTRDRAEVTDAFSNGNTAGYYLPTQGSIVLKVGDELPPSVPGFIWQVKKVNIPEQTLNIKLIEEPTSAHNGKIL